VKKTFSNAIVLFLIAGAVAVFVFDGVGSTLLPDGSPAPDFDLDKLGGGRVTSASMKGQVVMVDFWATWCGPCQAEMPWLVKVAKEYEAKGVQFVAAASPSDERPDVGIYAKDRVPGLEKYAAFADSLTAQRFKVEALPTLYVIGRDGKVLASTRGETSEWRVRHWLNMALDAK
jgi:thiol-disulfide isomerase/thioredoxin